MQSARNPSGALAYKEGNPTSRHQHKRASQRRHTTRTRLPNRETNQLSNVTRQRPNRQIRRNSPDPDHAQSYGTPISTPKNPSTIRILYKNIKGLSHNSSGEDHQYYLTHLPRSPCQFRWIVRNQHGVAASRPPSQLHNSREKGG